MTKPLDCIGTTSEIGKHDYGEHDPLTIAKEVLGNKLQVMQTRFRRALAQSYYLDNEPVTYEQVIEAANRCLASKCGEEINQGKEQ